MKVNKAAARIKMEKLDKETPLNFAIMHNTLHYLISNYKCYVIFFTPRSGSTWLTEIAKNTEKMGIPHELLNDHFLYGEGADFGIPTRQMLNINDINEYILNIEELSSSSNNVFGVELSRFQAEFVEINAEKGAYVTENISLFYLRRKNIVAQGISLYRSVASSAWHSHSMDEAAKQRYKDVDYDVDQIKFWIEHILNEYEIWFSMKFRKYGIDPIEIYYEELEESPVRTIDYMLRIIDTPPNEILNMKTQINMIRDEKNSIWETRFRSENRDYIMKIDETRACL